VGLIMDGVFSQDPAPGYPAGALASHPTMHGQVHTLFAFVAIMAMAAGCFVLAGRDRFGGNSAGTGPNAGPGGAGAGDPAAAGPQAGPAPLHRNAKNDAWLHTRCAAVNLRTLLRRGLPAPPVSGS
jgi:hypothetical protein